MLNSYVAVPQSKLKISKIEAVEAVIDAIGKIRKIYFVVCAKTPEGFNRETTIIVMCGKRKALGLLTKKWVSEGYDIRGSLTDKSYKFKEGKEFKVSQSVEIIRRFQLSN